MKWIFIILAVVVGAAMSMQAGINLRLRSFLGDPVLTAFVSFLVGAFFLGGLTFIQRTPLPPLAMVAQAPWWAWVGGALGAFVVASAVVLADQLGAAAMMAWIVAGQLLASVILDHWGMVGFAVREASPMRLLGAAMLVAGAFLVSRG